MFSFCDLRVALNRFLVNCFGSTVLASRNGYANNANKNINLYSSNTVLVCVLCVPVCVCGYGCAGVGVDVLVCLPAIVQVLWTPPLSLVAVSFARKLL